MQKGCDDMEWEKLFSGKYFISDLGEEQTVDGNNGKIILNRYAAWAPIPGAKNHQIVEISDKPETLMKKYNVPEENICMLI